MTDRKEHVLTLCDRATLKATGVLKIDFLTEEQVVAYTDFGGIKIVGKGLYVENLNAQSGELLVQGNVTAVIYFEKGDAKSILKRIFK